MTEDHACVLNLGSQGARVAVEWPAGNGKYLSFLVLARSHDFGAVKGS